MSGRASELQDAEAASGFSDLSDSEFLQIKEPEIGESRPLGHAIPRHLDSQGANVKERKRRTAKRKKAKSPLEAFHLRYLWVTDLSAQVWCEQEMVYHREQPGWRLPEKEMVLNTGKSLHLARELQEHDVVTVRTTSREDRWAIKLLNLLQTIADLREGRRVRECPVFGVLDDVFLVGTVDQLNYTAKGELQLNELKTREKACLPVPAQKRRDRFQVFLYKYLFDAMVQGCLTQDNFIHHLHLKPKQPLGSEIQEHAQKIGFTVCCFQDLLELTVLNLTHSDIPAIDRLQIEYVHQQTDALLGTEVITYDHDELMAMSHYFLAYWKGQRDPKGVDIEDAWKCCHCAFVDICDWRLQRARSLVKKCSEKKTLRSTHAMAKTKRRNCSFNDHLQKEFKSIKLDKLCSDGTEVVCQHCNIHFSIAHGGRSDIDQHLSSQKRKDAERTLASVKNISSSVRHDGDSESNKIAAGEAVFAYHTVRHGQSFRANDCLSTLIKKIYEPKFPSAHSKSEAIITVLSPYILGKVIEDLSKTKSIAVSLDASNKKDIKLFPIVVRYFLPNCGVQDKIVDFVSLPGETSDLQCAMLKEVIDKFALQNKIVALCADNTNTNFGGCNRLGENNVWRKLETELKRPIIGIGCGAHIIHNCLQCAVDCLPIDIDCFAVKVYKYFHMYTVRVEELKNFCDFAGNNYAKLLEHGNTSFLSLGSSVDRILSMFDELASFFLSQEKCPVLLRKWFEDPCLKLWLSFARDQVPVFQTYISLVEKDGISATEVAVNLENLVNNLESRKSEMFVTSDVKKQLKMLVGAGEINEVKFFEVVKTFYETSLEYINKWKCSIGNTEKFKWVLLRKTPEWKEIQDSLNEEFITRTKTEETRAFDQWALIKSTIVRRLDTWNRENISVSDRWVEIFSEMSEKRLDCQDFCNIVEFILCLPGSAAPVKRILSVMNRMWSKEKSRLSVETVRAMLVVKQNCVVECEKFYDEVLKDRNLLRKITSLEKYSWYDHREIQSPSTST